MKYLIVGIINVILSCIMIKVHSMGIIVIPIIMLGLGVYLFESSKQENANKKLTEIVFKIVIVGLELIILNTFAILIITRVAKAGLIGIIVGIFLLYIWQVLILKILDIDTEVGYVLMGILMNGLVFVLMYIEYISMYYLNGGLGYNLIEPKIIYIVMYAMLMPIGYIIILRLSREEKIVNNKNKLLLFIILLIGLPIVSVIVESMNKPMGEVINISTCGDLNNINKNGRYKLVKDIDCQNQKVNTIGFFSGEIDGNSKKISNVVVSNKLIERMNNQGSIENIEFNNINISGNVNTGIVGINYGRINKVKVSNSEIKGESGVGVVGKNYSSEVEEIALENTKISGISEVGGVVGINGMNAKVENISIDEKSEVSGYSKVGSVTGVNKGKIDHTFSSGNIVDKSKEQAEDYMGMINGQQVDGGWTQHTVYNGKYVPMSENIFSGMSKDIITKDKISETCVKEEYNKNKKMTRGEYTKLIEEGGKCEQYQLTNEERRENYLAEDSLNGYEVSPVQKDVWNYYYGLPQNGLMNFDEEIGILKGETGKDKSIFPLLPITTGVIAYEVPLRIWMLEKVYDMWYVEQATGINYASPSKSATVKDTLRATGIYNFDGANIWNLDVYPPKLKLEKN